MYWWPTFGHLLPPFSCLFLELPTEIGVHPFSFSEQTLIHLTQLKQVSYEAFPGKSSLPYFSDGIYCCYFCLLTALNLHLDQAMFHPRMTIPLPVSLLDYEVLEGIETRFSSSLSPQSPAWDCYKACCYVSSFLMNYSMNRLGKTRLTSLLMPLICFFFFFFVILSIKQYTFLNCDDQALLWCGLSLELLVQTNTYNYRDILKQMKVKLLDLKLG